MPQVVPVLKSLTDRPPRGIEPDIRKPIIERWNELLQWARDADDFFSAVLSKDFSKRAVVERVQRSEVKELLCLHALLRTSENPGTWWMDRLDSLLGVKKRPEAESTPARDSCEALSMHLNDCWGPEKFIREMQRVRKTIEHKGHFPKLISYSEEYWLKELALYRSALKSPNSKPAAEAPSLSDNGSKLPPVSPDIRRAAKNNSAAGNGNVRVAASNGARPHAENKPASPPPLPPAKPRNVAPVVPLVTPQFDAKSSAANSNGASIVAKVAAPPKAAANGSQIPKPAAAPSPQKAPLDPALLRLKQTQFILSSIGILHAAENNPEESKPSKCSDRAELLERAAIVVMILENGDVAKASARAGVLGSSLLRLVQTAESRFELGGLGKIVSNTESINALQLPATIAWPTNLEFSFWHSVEVNFTPAPPVSAAHDDAKTAVLQ